jgi:hypothetical protein
MKVYWSEEHRISIKYIKPQRRNLRVVILRQNRTEELEDDFITTMSKKQWNQEMPVRTEEFRMINIVKNNNGTGQICT